MKLRESFKTAFIFLLFTFLIMQWVKEAIAFGIDIICYLPSWELVHDYLQIPNSHGINPFKLFLSYKPLSVEYWFTSEEISKFGLQAIDDKLYEQHYLGCFTTPISIIFKIYIWSILLFMFTFLLNKWNDVMFVNGKSEKLENFLMFKVEIWLRYFALIVFILYFIKIIIWFLWFF